MMKFYDEGTVIGAVYHALRTTLLNDNSDNAKMAVAVEIVNKLTTADVREVVHGEWKKESDDTLGMPIPTYECSHCHAWITIDPSPITLAQRYPYCPFCGAYMRGGE